MFETMSRWNGIHRYVTHKMFAFNTIRLQFNGDFWVKRWPNEMRTLNKHSWNLHTRTTHTHTHTTNITMYRGKKNTSVIWLASWLLLAQTVGPTVDSIIIIIYYYYSMADDDDDVGFNLVSISLFVLRQPTTAGWIFRSQFNCKYCYTHR